MFSEKIDLLAAALPKVQAALKPPKKDSENPHFKSMYADLASDWDACRSALTEHGFSVVQITECVDWSKPMLVTILLHSSGQWISGSYPLQPTKQDPQALKSAVTYARRTALESIVGLAAEDDDGNDAAAPPGRSPAAKPLPSKPPSGQWISGSYPLQPTKQDPQALKSAVTYARRTALESIVGLAAEDDDGNDAAAPPGRSPAAKPLPSKPQPQAPAKPPPPAAPTARPAAPTVKGSISQNLRAKAEQIPKTQGGKQIPAWRNEPATEAQIRRLRAVAGIAGYDNDHLKDVVVTAFGHEHVDELTRGEIQDLFRELEGEK